MPREASLALSPTLSEEHERVEAAKASLLALGEEVGKSIRAHGAERTLMTKLLRACTELFDAKAAAQ
jgi:hypothetical protein